jgi:hypothetical protein
MATVALRAGIHPKVVQERLGHSSIAIMLDTYSHVPPTPQRAAAETLAELLSGGRHRPPASWSTGSLPSMAESRKLLTAAELDQMTPDQRAAAVREHVVTDLDELPASFRRRVEETAGRLSDQLQPRPGE